MTISDCFVSVVAPLHNDSDIVEDYIEEIIGVLNREYANYELVLVEGGSRDDTVEKVSIKLKNHKCIRLIRLSKHFGQEAAITAGLDSVIGDFIVIMMPESDPPELIPQILEECRKGAGIVFGVRKHRKNEPLYLRIGANIFYRFMSRIMKVQLHKNTTDFLVLSRQALNAIIKFKDRLRFLRFCGDYIGYGSDYFEYEPAFRRQKPRVRSFGEAVRLAFNMIIVNSPHPLRFVSLLGFGLSLLSVLYLGYVVIVRLLVQDVEPGWASQSLHSSIMFLFLFLVLAILCEYIGTLFAQIQGRPSYFVLEERNSSVLVVDEDRKNVVAESKQE